MAHDAKWLLRGAVGIGLYALILFGAAGTVRWPMAWAYLALVTVFAGIVLLGVRDDALFAERARWHADAPLWDKILLPVAVLLSLLPLVVAAVDIGRLHWSPAVPFAASLAALAATAGAYGLVVWAMWVNAFFSSAVRIQTERGHRVVTAGPYRYVRHPGYLGHVAAMLAAPLMLGSLLGVIAAAPAVLAILLRTALEDRFLIRRLPGYAEYAARTRHRLVPGLW